MATGSHECSGYYPATLATGRTGRSTGPSRGATGTKEVSVSAARRARTRSARLSADNALRAANCKIGELEGQNAELLQKVKELQQSEITMTKMHSLQRSIEGLQAELTQNRGGFVKGDGDQTQTENFDIASFACTSIADDEVSEVGSIRTILAPEGHCSGSHFVDTETLLEDGLCSLSVITGVTDDCASFALFRGATHDEVSPLYDASALSLPGQIESHISHSTQTEAHSQDGHSQTLSHCTQTVGAQAVVVELPKVLDAPAQTTESSFGTHSDDEEEPKQVTNAFSQTVPHCTQTVEAQTVEEVLPKVHDAHAQTAQSSSWANSDDEEEPKLTSDATSQTVSHRPQVPAGAGARGLQPLLSRRIQVAAPASAPTGATCQGECLRVREDGGLVRQAEAVGHVRLAGL